VMHDHKSVLLIGGGGTLGSYVAQESLSLGYCVDIICLEDKISDNERLNFYKADATEAFLTEFLSRKRYDGIVNFIHYDDPEDYKPVHELLIANTDHLIFVSSYRVYADLQHPVTESAPMLLDVSRDKMLLEKETYALSKAKAERFLRNEHSGENWTIVRPVISFSHNRFDLVTYFGHDLLHRIKAGETILLPKQAKDLVAGIDWAGNTGKIIAHLLFKQQAIGEAFTVSSAQNVTWEQVAALYGELCGAKFRWVELDDYLRANRINLHALLYDRLYDRTIDNRKVLQATGLRNEDFLSIKEGLKIEFSKLEEGEWA